MTTELVGNALCLDFTNTVNRRPDPDRDDLTTVRAAVAWARAVGLPVPNRVRHGSGELDRLRWLRERVHDVFAAVADGADPPAEPLRDVADIYATRLHHAVWRRTGNAMTPEQPQMRRLLDVAWPVAASAVDLLQTGPLDRVGRCPGCGWLFLDVTRNGRRRWCSMATCGSREKTARFHARHSAAR